MPNPTSKLNLVINGATTQLDIHDSNAVDLTSNQTVAGNKEFTGTTTAHDLIPSATNTYNFGSPSVQWNNAYIKSLTINGTQFLPSDYMTLNTNQTVTSAKNYANYQTINSYRLRIKSTLQEKGVIPASNLWNGFDFCDKNNERMFSIEQGMTPNGVIQLNFSGRANDNDTTYTTFLQYINNSDLTTNYVNVIDLMPFGNGTRKLGDTNAKWKTINGVEPSNLSLPSDTSINIDTTDFAWNTNFTFTPSVNGYLFISIPASTGTRKLSLKSGRGEYYFSNQIDILRFTMPVYKGKLVTILTASTIAETVIPSLSLFPLQGNV